MAKKIKEEGEVKTPKPKKIKEPVIEKTTVEEQPTSLTEPVVEEPIVETPIAEEEVILQNVSTEFSVPKEELVIKPTEKEGESIISLKRDIVNDERSMEQKITDFLDSREGSDIKLNDFLKSLFGVPKFNEPPNWLSQGASKQLRVLLGDMQTKGLISISNNMHTKLGTFYYDGNSPVTLYHSLNTVPLVAKK